MLREVESQLNRGPYPTLLVHPDDAVERALGDGHVVEVASSHGAVRAMAEVTDSIRPGAVSLTHAWASPNANALTSYGDVDPVTLMPRFTGQPVKVARVHDPNRRTEPAWR
ncbi:MAG: molybdopterin dinucleotide binding domain-containing protein [Acidimicrobiales bacterium]